MTARIFDLSHTFTNDMPVYPGDPVPSLEASALIETDGYTEYQFCGGMHVGTHMDAPLHMIAGGQRMCEVPVSKFVGRGRLIDARGRPSIGLDLLDGVSLNAGDIVVVMTGWYRLFRTPPYYDDYPEVEPDFATHLTEVGVAVLALDTPSPDRAPFAIHKILLGNGVLIVENVTDVEDLIGLEDFEVIALPAKLDCEAAPARVIARTTP